MNKLINKYLNISYYNYYNYSCDYNHKDFVFIIPAIGGPSLLERSGSISRLVP